MMHGTLVRSVERKGSIRRRLGFSKGSRAGAVLLPVMALLLSARCFAAGYVLTDIGKPVNSYQAEPFSVNGSAQVVGIGYYSLKFSVTRRGLFYSKSLGMIDLGMLAGASQS